MGLAEGRQGGGVMRRRGHRGWAQSGQGWGTRWLVEVLLLWGEGGVRTAGSMGRWCVREGCELGALQGKAAYKEHVKHHRMADMDLMAG